ncbi:MAG: hypothetical protein ACWGPR_08570 [Candidatus Deferrimicrobiaceae bacterium]
MANALDVTLHAAGQETTSTSAIGVDIGAYRSAVRLNLACTEVTGGPLAVFVETSQDNSTGWRPVGAFVSVSSAPKKLSLSVLDCDQYVRVRWTLTTTATFAVYGTAHTLFADPDDMPRVFPAVILDGISMDTQADALITASCDAEDAISHTRELPITKWSASMRRRVAVIAAYRCMMSRGFNPDNPSDEVLRMEADKAEKWLAKVQKDELRPANTEPESAMGPQTSSGNPDAPTTYPKRMSDNWGSF